MTDYILDERDGSDALCLINPDEWHTIDDTANRRFALEAAKAMNEYAANLDIDDPKMKTLSKLQFGFERVKELSRASGLKLRSIQQAENHFSEGYRVVGGDGRFSVNPAYVKRMRELIEEDRKDADLLATISAAILKALREKGAVQ